jgi:heparinase II/III-like protein
LTMDPKPRYQRWQRLITMRPAEAYDRLRQGMSARLDLARAHLGFSFAPKLGSADRDTGHFFFDPQSVPSICALLKKRLPQQAEQIIAEAQQICRHRFDLLAYEGIDYGTEIDWHCDCVHKKRAPRRPWFKIHYLDFEEVGDSKVTWELNRHQHLVTLAKAYRLSGREEFSAELLAQWDHWQRNNPYPIGINWASSLEVAFRSFSWLWVYFLLADSPALPADFREKWLRALAIHGRHIERHLSTYFSPNTHLLGEAVALFFIGTLCPEIPAAQRWKLRGWQMTLREAERQVLSDGLHCEQSAYYHVYALDFFLHARVLASVNGVPIPWAFDQAIEKMLNALCVLGRAAAPPRLGDDDGGRVFDGRRNRAEHMLDPLATGAAMFRRGDFKSVAGGLREETLWLLSGTGVSAFDAIGSPAPAQEWVSLAIDGLHVLSGPDAQLVFDAGTQGAFTAGHGHADALSVTLATRGRALLVDPGTFEYVGRQRNLFRGTAAHNTLRVDEEDQAEPRGPFGWMKLPRVRTERQISGKTFDLVAASHDGYARLKGPVVHQRWVFSAHSGLYFVRDVALGIGEHRLELSWHLAAGLSPQPDGRFFGSDGSGLGLLTAGMAAWSRENFEDWWSPAYGVKLPAYTLRLRGAAQLPTEVATLLVPANITQSQGTLVHLNSRTPARIGAYRYVTPEAEHFVCFAREPGAWQAGAWSSDAEFLYSMVSRDGSCSKLICCHATSVSFAGQQIVSCPVLMLCCEIICTGRQCETFSSEPGAIVNEAAARAVAIEPEPASTTPSRLSGHRKL